MKRPPRKYKTVDDVIAKLRSVHGDKYDYSLVELEHRITLICPKHGPWTASRSDIFRGSGCAKCNHESRIGTGITNEQFIEKARAIHGDKYDYSFCNFVGWEKPVDIFCPKHQKHNLVSPANFAITGCGTKCCMYDKVALAKAHTTEKFIEDAIKVHGTRYNYSKVAYINQNEKVEIICQKHGSFWQNPSNHKYGHGCPKCASSFADSSSEIALADSFPLFKRHDRTIIKPKELDLVSHDHKLAIEVNGVYWHSSKFLPSRYHLEKTDEVEAKGYQLLHFWDFEVNEQPDLVKSMIASKLRASNKMHARKCSVLSVDASQARAFEEENHLQGYTGGESVRYGLIYNGILVALMTFGKSRFDKNYDWELIRFCCLQGHTVVGGASKLFKHFLNHHSGSIMSYANRRISSGGLYRALGFREVARTEPNYFWFSLRNGARLSRQKCQKHRLASVLGDRFDAEKTEKENMMENGYVQCFDAGNIKYEYII